MGKKQRNLGNTRIIDEQTNVVIKKHNRTKTWRYIVASLAVVVLVCAIYQMILPTLTMDKQTYCGQNDHLHTSACYEQSLSSGQAEQHVHKEECYADSTNSDCGQKEAEGCTCVEAENQIICTEPDEGDAIGHIYNSYEKALDFIKEERTHNFDKPVVVQNSVEEENIAVCDNNIFSLSKDEQRALRAADPTIYYEIRDEGDEKVLHLSSTPFEEVNIYTKNTLVSAIKRTINRIVIDDPITAPVNSSNLFSGYTNAVAIDGLTNLITDNVTNMQGLFYNCRDVTEFDLSNFNTSKVGTFTDMFFYCESLTELDLSSFDTQKGYYINALFVYCKNLERVNLSSFVTKNAGDISSLFNQCKNLKEVDLSNFDTSNAKAINTMFAGCESLKRIDLSNFNTKKVTNYYGLFSGCHSLEELDISSFVINDKANVQYFFDMRYSGTAVTGTSISKIESPAYVADGLNIELPLLMMNQNDRYQVFSHLPKQSQVTESITLVPYEAAILEEESDSQLFFKKYLDGVLVNEPLKFDFAVFTEDGTDTGLRIKNEADGNIIVETAGLPAGRYYVQEIYGNDSIRYDTEKKYFTIVEETVSKSIVYQSTEYVYIPISEDYLDTSKYDLVANVKTITAYEKGTQNPVMTMRAYCADKSKRIVRVPVGTTQNSVFINPTEDEINLARGVVYNGPHVGELPEAIKTILCGNPDIIQGELWGLLNYLRPIDMSYSHLLPNNVKWAIIARPNENLQPLIVPLWTTQTRENFESVEGDTIKTRYVKLETTDTEFRNETLPEDAVPVRITAKKTLTDGNLRAGQFSFVLKDINGDILQTKKNSSDGTITFDPIIYYTADYGQTYIYTVSEIIGTSDEIIYDETIYTVEVTIDSEGNATYKMYRGLPESVTDNLEYSADHFIANGNDHCLSIDNRVAYCFNLDRKWPLMDQNSPINDGYKCNEGYTKLGNVSDQDLQNYSNGAIKEDILRVIYNGYPYDKAGLKSKYGLSDEQFRAVTQVALWYYTEGAYLLIGDTMTEKQRANATVEKINMGIGSFDGDYWTNANDTIKEKMYKCMADLSGATVKYGVRMYTLYADMVYYTGDTTSLQMPSGDLILDLFIHPTDGASIDEEQKIQNLLSVGTISPTGETITREEVSEIIFENTDIAEKGNLIITKTIQGNVTEEEANGAITFNVTAPDGTVNTYTLRDFTKNSDGVYTLELNDIAIGEYLVEETTRDINGKALTVTYTVNNGAATEGSRTGVAVTDGNTSTVAFTNNYESIYELPETGGFGTKGYEIIGVLLMGGLALIMYKKRQARKAGKSMK